MRPLGASAVECMRSSGSTSDEIMRGINCAPNSYCIVRSSTGNSSSFSQTQRTEARIERLETDGEDNHIDRVRITGSKKMNREKEEHSVDERTRS
jgi:hypothetical protein